MKVFLKIVLLLALVVYLGFVFTSFNKADRQERCVGVEIVVKDSAQASFIDEGEVRSLLRKAGLYPENKLMERIDSRKIEKVLCRNPFIESAQCYKTAAGTINISISQRLPVIRVMDNNGNNYYMDGQGKKMPRLDYPADLVVVTGNVTPQYVAKNLVKVAAQLQKDPFWDGQIVQLHVDRRGGIEMVPRVGEHLVYLGEPKNVREKLDNLRIFYEKVLSEVGWNKYSLINLEFSNQIICKKK